MAMLRKSFALIFSCVIFKLVLSQTVRNLDGTNLVVSQNPDGNGITVIDTSTNKQLINTSNLNLNNRDDDSDEQVVRGLLEWLEEKKKKKKDKNKKPEIIPQPIPIIQPIPIPIKPQEPRKEIHIHINNHIKKKDHYQHKNKKNQQHKKHNHYESYHEGHYDDYHDKYYQGKHSFPLLSHHHNWDFYGDHHSAGGYQDHDHYDEDYSGHESNAQATVAKRENTGRQTG